MWNTWPLFTNPIFYTHYYMVSELFVFHYPFVCVSLRSSSDRPGSFRSTPGRPHAGYGIISYSLYMWHLPLLLVFIKWGPPLLSGWPPEQAYSVYWVWVLLVIFPFCFLFFIWV